MDPPEGSAMEALSIEGLFDLAEQGMVDSEHQLLAASQSQEALQLDLSGTVVDQELDHLPAARDDGDAEELVGSWDGFVGS